LGVWEKYKEICKKKKEPLDFELKAINLKISELQFSEESLSSLEKKQEEIIKEKKEKEKELNELKKDFSNKKDKLNNLKNLIGDRKQIETKYNDAALYFQESKENLQYIKDSIKGSLESIKENKDILLRKKELLNKKTEELTKLIKSMPEEIEESFYDKEQNKLARHKMKLKEKTALYRILKKPLPESASCPECNTLLDEEKRKELIENKNQEAKNVKEEIEKLESLVLDSEGKIKKIEKTLLTYRVAKNKNLEISNQISILNSTIESYENSIKDTAVRVEQLKERKVIR
jgi:exonuclease SbcC